MNNFHNYVNNSVKFTNSLTKLASIKYRLDVLQEFTKHISSVDVVDDVTLYAAESLGINNSNSIKVGIEEVIKSVSQAILKYVNQVTKGFMDLSSSFCEYQKNLMNSTNHAFNILAKTYESNSNFEEVEVREDIPNFHEFKKLTQCMLIFTQATFQDKLQNLIGSESLFGLKSKNNFITYEEIIPTELTSSLLTKLGISYERNSKEEDDATNGSATLETLRFTNPFKIPFEVSSYNNKTIAELGYSDINELKKFTKSVESSILALIHDLPELADKCKNANTLTQQQLSNDEDTLTEDEAKTVVDTTMLWGNMTESCLKCITFYMRAYQEILNVLYKSIKEHK